MATILFSNTKTFLPSIPSISSSSSSSSSAAAAVNAQKHNLKSTQLIICKAAGNDTILPNVVLTKRNLAIGVTLNVLLSLAGGKGCLDYANAAILEADDDVELLEKVKQDRKKRLERQGVISSATKEKAYLQDVVYKLSKVGEAIEKNDLSAASSVLGQSTDTDWVQKVNQAFDKLSYGPEEKTEVDAFNSSLSTLISSITKNDIEACKLAFVESASALEKWTALTGLVGQLKGL